MIYSCAMGVHSVVVSKLKGEFYSSVGCGRGRGHIYCDQEELAAWFMYHDSALSLQLKKSLTSFGTSL